MLRGIGVVVYRIGGKLFVEERSGHVDGQVGDLPLRAGVRRPSTSSAVCVLRRGDSVSRLTSL